MKSRSLVGSSTPEAYAEGVNRRLTLERASADFDLECRFIPGIGRKLPGAFGAERGQLARRGRIVGEDADAALLAKLARGAGQAKRRPGAEHAPRIDQLRVRTHYRRRPGLAVAGGWAGEPRRAGRAGRPRSPANPA